MTLINTDCLYFQGPPGPHGSPGQPGLRGEKVRKHNEYFLQVINKDCGVI